MWVGSEKGQGELSPEEGGKTLESAFQLGVNFWDTSDDYGSHPHVAEGLRRVDRKEIVIADKSYARTFEEGKKAVSLALGELETDYVDLMMLHYVPFETSHFNWGDENASRPEIELGNLEERRGALRAFCEARKDGIVRAVGLSTHSTKVLKQTLSIPEIEVVCTTLNKNSTYMDDGSLQDRIEMIRLLYESGKGIYVIKVLDQGKLCAEAESSLRFALQYHRFIHAWNIGMYSIDDVANNAKILKEALSSDAR